MKNIIKIFSVLLLSLIITIIGAKTLFLADSPKINKFLFVNFFNKDKNLMKDSVMISKGIYAREENGVKIFEFKQNEIEWVEYSFNINGREIKINVPKDQKPPTEDFIRRIYK